MKRIAYFLGPVAAALVAGPAFSGDQVTLQARADFAPFADASWTAKGMVTEILDAAMATGPDAMALNVFWPDGVAPEGRVERHEVDMAYPWPKPNCTAIDPATACSTLHFSDPLIELIWLLFTPVDAQFEFERPQDLAGKTVCVARVTAGSELAAAGLNWVPNTSADVRFAANLAECFDLLIEGQADAVAVNEFEGVAQLFAQNLTEQVVPLPRPVATQPLHLVTSRTHWRGTTLIYRVNAGLAKLRQTGAYGEIVSRHVAEYWAGINR